MAKLSLRKRLWHALTPSARPKGLSSLNLFLGAAILLAVLLAILETEPVERRGKEPVSGVIGVGYPPILASRRDRLGVWIELADLLRAIG